MPISIDDFGSTNDENISLITIKLNSGFSASFSQYGAAIVRIICKDIKGEFSDVVQGYDSVEGYVNGGSCQGAVIGRFANRIANATIDIDNKKYQLNANCGKHLLHGGNVGFQNSIWEIESLGENFVEFSYLSQDMDAGFPGNLRVKVKYTVENDSVRIDYYAAADKKTAVNLTNHAYFNLSGKHDSQVNDNILQIDADMITIPDEMNVPTGEFKDVTETIFDFRKPRAIGENSYDHNFVLNGFKGLENKDIFKASSLYDPKSGRIMHCYTNKPGIQVYTANGLNEIGKGNVFMPSRSSICLETQYFPDSPNQKSFPYKYLDIGEEYSFTTIYKFEVGKDL
ncbi:MAG: galactose mutarotase [Clostridiales bacterium]|nr:galactose mutarotase [Clostridiales bacterium]